jgi:hypothetical protein
MAGIDDVLERLVTDDAFRAQLAADPDAALASYELSPADRALLASQVSADAGQAGAMEGRASKAGLFGMLGGLDEIADAIAGGAEDRAGPQAVAGAGTPPEPDSSPPYNPYVTVDHVETLPADPAEAGYDYPGEYASRFDDVAPPQGGDAAGDGDWAAGVEQPAQGTYGDAGEQTYLAIKLENAQVPSAPTTDVAAPSSDVIDIQPDTSDLEFVSRPADAGAGGGTVLEDIAIQHEVDKVHGVNELSMDDTPGAERVDDPSAAMGGEDSRGLWQINATASSDAGGLAAPEPTPEDSEYEFHDPWPSKVESGGFDTALDGGGELPASDDLTGEPVAAAPSADAGGEPNELTAVERPATSGDAGEHTYLKVELENVQVPSAPPTDVAAPSPDAIGVQPNESDLDFVERRADEAADTDVAVEKVTITHESIDRARADEASTYQNTFTAIPDSVPDEPGGEAGYATEAPTEEVMGFMHMSAGTQDAAPEPAPTPGGVEHQDDWDAPAPAGEDFYSGWIELNSVTEPAAPPDPSDLEVTPTEGEAAGADGDIAAAGTTEEGWIELNSVTQTVTDSGEPEPLDLEVIPSAGEASGDDTMVVEDVAFSYGKVDLPTAGEPATPDVHEAAHVVQADAAGEPPGGSDASVGASQSTTVGAAQAETVGGSDPETPDAGATDDPAEGTPQEPPDR